MNLGKYEVGREGLQRANRLGNSLERGPYNKQGMKTVALIVACANIWHNASEQGSKFGYLGQQLLIGSTHELV